MFIDENGNSSLKGITRAISRGDSVPEDEKHFSVTSVIVEKTNINNIKDTFVAIKNRHWPDEGCFDYDGKYQKVCLHSYEIRNRKGPFNHSVINRDEFLSELTVTMGDFPIHIRTAYINKALLLGQYYKPNQPYHLALTFLLERLVKFNMKNDDKAIIILEARGKDMDHSLLMHLNEIVNTGTPYCTPAIFHLRIEGIYFNPKRPSADLKKSYYGLEIADLCGFPIHKYCRQSIKDQSFLVIENKICFKGIKKFPQ